MADREQGDRAPRANDAPAGPTLHIRLLGDFQVRVGTRVVADQEWRLLKARALVKLLALAPRHRLGREEVQEILWPEAEPEAGRNNAYYALHVARRALDRDEHGTAIRPSLLGLNASSITLQPPGGLACDVVAFEAAVARARHTQQAVDYHAAIASYGGDLLPDDRYEDWASKHREALRERYLALFMEVARLHEAQGEDEAAIDLLRRLVALEPPREEAHVALMRLFAAGGRRDQALRQYARLHEALRQELATEPDPTSQQLYATILAGHAPALAVAKTVTATAPAAAQPALPTPLTRFIGREQELAVIGQLLAPGAEQSRLLTLTGAGGSGKTRLALAAAGQATGQYPDGVLWLELGAITDPALVVGALGRALEVREQAGEMPLAAIVAALRPKSLLLVLDNCEHLIETCAALAEELLLSCPQIRLLTTSRAALNLTGELVWRVPSFALPDPLSAAPQQGDLARLARADAAQLFLDRVTLRDPTFVLTAQNGSAVVTICRELDGIPLALELAAGCVPALSVEQVAARLPDALSLLGSGGRSRQSRQKTIRATLDWSHALLSADEAALLARLAVFAGGWTLPAAEAICVDEQLTAGRVLGLLTRLVDTSLVLVQLVGGETRYRLLEIVRQYVRERLQARGEVAAMQRRHAAWYLARAEEAAPNLTGSAQGSWLDRLERERANQRGALQWLVASAEAKLALRLGCALWRFWYTRGYFSEGRHWLTAALALPQPTPPALRAQALAAFGGLAYGQGDYIAAQAVYEEALVLRQQYDSPQQVAQALRNLALTLNMGGDVERARELLQQALVLSQHSDDVRGIAVTASRLGELARHQGATSEARDYYGQALDFFREDGDHANVALMMGCLGSTAWLEGDLGSARALHEESLLLHRQINEKLGIARQLGNLGIVASDQGDLAVARARLIECQALCLELNSPYMGAFCLEGFAGLSLATGDPLRAARLWGAAEVVLGTTGASLPTTTNRAYYERQIAEARQQSGAVAPFAAAWAAGRGLAMAEALAEAVAGS